MASHTEDRAETDLQRDYMRTVAELQEIARKAPYVTQDWVLQVASMDPAEMRRRLIRSYDWHNHFSHSLDGIAEVRNLPGAAPDGCWDHRSIRGVVMCLLQRIERLKTANGPHRRAPEPT